MQALWLELEAEKVVGTVATPSLFFESKVDRQLSCGHEKLLLGFYAAGGSTVMR